jgi:hypothetical protein
MIRITTKIRLFNTNVKLILLYGAKTWRTTVTTGTMRNIQVFINTCLRKILEDRPEPVAQSIRSYDCGSEGMGFDPHSGQSKVRLFSLSILTDKIVLVVQSCRVPTPPSTDLLVSV